MEFGDLLLKSWSEYKQNFGTILKIFLVLSLIPSVIFAILVFFFGLKTEITTLSEIMTFLPLVLIGFFAIIILSFIMTLAYVYMGFGKKNISFGESIKGGLKSFWRFIGLAILVFLIFLLFFLPMIIFSILMYVNVYFIILSIIFFIIGFVFVIKYYVSWVFTVFILVKENVGPLEAMRRSKTMVKGKWWGTFGYIILLGIIIILISIPFSIIGLFVGILGSLSALITTPLTLLFIKNFYLDRKGGKAITPKGVHQGGARTSARPRDISKKIFTRGKKKK